MAQMIQNIYNNMHIVNTQLYFSSFIFHYFSFSFYPISMIHINIRSAKKKSKKLKDFLSQTCSFFKALCLPETSFDDRNSESSLYQQPQYTAIHQHRSPSHKGGRGTGISMYIHGSLNSTSRRDQHKK